MHEKKRKLLSDWVMWYHEYMKAKELLNAVFKRCSKTKKEIAIETGVSDVVVGKAIRSQTPGLDVTARYLKAMGYRLYAVPETLHLEAISDDVIQIEPEERKL